MATFPAKTNYAAGNVLTAAQMVDIGEQINALNGNAGKNKIINGDFAINQRSFTSTTTSATYGFDRWIYACADGTVTYSAQTFTPGSAPVVGYEAANFARIQTTGQTLTTASGILRQFIEDVRTFAGQTITISFWAKAASGTPKVAVEIQQGFGTGGSPSATVNTYGNQVTLSTSWARYSVTMSVPSISGKTIGTTTPGQLNINLWVSAGSSFDSRTGSLGIQTNTFDFWGVQMEAGSVATAFQTATGTLAGELQAAQRYYSKSYQIGTSPATNNAVNYEARMSVDRTDQYALDQSFAYPVTMRTAPTITLYAYANSATGNVYDAGAGVNRAATASVVGDTRAQISLNSGVTTTANATHLWHWVANAEL